MEKLNAQEIEQFLKIEKEIGSSADHREMTDQGKFWGGEDTISSMTITTSMTTGAGGIKN